MRTLAFLAVALVASLLYVYRADSYQVVGKFDHNAITYSCGSPELQQAVETWAELSGLTDGGCSENPDIVLILPNPWPYSSNILGTAAYTLTNFPNLPMVIKQCTIAIKPNSVHYLPVYVHEVGHCLGSSHSDVQDSIMAPWCCTPISDDDIAMIRFLYGPPEIVTVETLGPVTYRSYVPMVSQ